MPVYLVRVKCPVEVKVGETSKGLPKYKKHEITETFELNAATPEQAHWLMTKSGPTESRVRSYAGYARMRRLEGIGDKLRRRGCHLENIVIEEAYRSATRPSIPPIPEERKIGYAQTTERVSPEDRARLLRPPEVQRGYEEQKEKRDMAYQERAERIMAGRRRV